MVSMMRVPNCCGACSVRTGTLIILWLELILRYALIVASIIAICDQSRKNKFFDFIALMWESIQIVIILFALYGVKKHRASYLLPYLSMYVLNVFLLIPGATIYMLYPNWKDEIINYVNNKTTNEEIQSTYSLYSAFLFMTVLFLPIIGILFYYFSVVYSYYKQMQEEVIRFLIPGRGIVYATLVNEYN